VATSSHARHFEIKTRKHRDVFDLFDHIVTGDQVTHGKPAPDIFRAAAEGFAPGRGPASPARCLVFEVRGDGAVSSPFAVSARLRPAGVGPAVRVLSPLANLFPHSSDPTGPAAPFINPTQPRPSPAQRSPTNPQPNPTQPSTQPNPTQTNPTPIPICQPQNPQDAPVGVEAAVAAGMPAVFVPDPNLDAGGVSGAAAVLPSLEAFDPAEWGLPPYPGSCGADAVRN
jgi:hypothetical protein